MPVVSSDDSCCLLRSSTSQTNVTLNLITGSGKCKSLPKCHNCLKTSLFLALHIPSFLAALLPSLLPYFLPSILLYQAVQEYQAQIASVAGQVLEQYQQLFGPAFLPGEKPLDPTSQEQRKTKLLGELNYSGKYFAFKEQIKVRKGLVAFIRHQNK